MTDKDYKRIFKKVKPRRSKCCGAMVHIEGSMPDFVGEIGEGYASTKYFVCENCRQPCDIK